MRSDHETAVAEMRRAKRRHGIVAAGAMTQPDNDHLRRETGR
jgi:hypothetical protein